MRTPLSTPFDLSLPARCPSIVLIIVAFADAGTTTICDTYWQISQKVHAGKKTQNHYFLSPPAIRTVMLSSIFICVHFIESNALSVGRIEFHFAISMMLMLMFNAILWVVCSTWIIIMLSILQSCLIVFCIVRLCTPSEWGGGKISIQPLIGGIERGSVTLAKWRSIDLLFTRNMFWKRLNATEIRFESNYVTLYAFYDIRKCYRTVWKSLPIVVVDVCYCHAIAGEITRISLSA